VKKWIEVALKEQVESAIEVPSSVGTALCMAAALKKAHEEGKTPGYLVTSMNYRSSTLNRSTPEKLHTRLS
jgi:hypothetical protein